MYIAARTLGDSLRMYMFNGPFSLSLRSTFAPFKILAYILFAPFLLIAAMAALVCVLIDFTIFRTRDLVAGHPEPKGLWEF